MEPSAAGFVTSQTPLLPWSIVLIAAILIGANEWSTSRGAKPFMVTPPTTTATTPQAGH
jgi:hypothetical protein